MKLAVITTHPIQYQAPVWRALARQPGVDLQVIFASDFSIKGYRDSGFGTSFKWDQPLTEGYSFEVLGSGVKGGFLSLSSKGLEAALRASGAEVVLIKGYFPKFYLDAFRIARRLHLKVLLRAELTDRDRDRGFLAHLAKDAYARLVYHHVDRFLAIGENAKSHLRRLGIEEHRIDFAGYNVDDDLFKAQAARYLPERARLRSEQGVTEGDFVLLVCGKLIAKKNPLLAVEAFNRLPESVRGRCRLIFLGEGQLRPEIEARMPADGRITITGFVNQGELGKYYAMADAALLPSQFGETWGLVVNEAQLFGLPVLASDRVGSVPDLITPETGRVFPSGDSTALAEAITGTIPWAEEHRAAISEAARAKVAQYSAQRAAEAIAASARTALSA